MSFRINGWDCYLGTWPVPPPNHRYYREARQEVNKSFNRFDDKTAEADINVVFAWQSGHRPIQRATTYGLDGAFPTQLQPALLRFYEWASARWHEFLHQPSKVLPPRDTAVIYTDARGPLPPSRQLDTTIDSQNAKQRSPPWLQDEAPMSADYEGCSARTEPGTVFGDRDLAPPAAKQPAHPANIILRVEAWKDGASRTPVSDHEGDSPIDWDEPDMIPSTARVDGLPSSPRAPWPSWSRHNRRIEAKIDKARQFHGVFDLKTLRPDEQRAIRELQRHPELPCLPRAKLLCARWKQGTLNEWTATGSKCQYGVVVSTIVTALEGAVEVREELDCWMDSWIHSRNLDRVCQWLSERMVGNDLCALRAMEVFQVVSGAWGRLNYISQGYYHSPRLSWITSTGPASEANNAADEAAYAKRKHKRQTDMTRNQREAVIGLILTPAYSRGHDVNAYHTLEACQDEQREVITLEITQLQEIKFTVGECCQTCAVPQETRSDSVYSSIQGAKECLYDGVVREAVAAIMVIGPDIVVEKMRMRMRSERIWSTSAVLSTKGVKQVTQMILEWFSREASWRHYSASVLVQVYGQLDRWVEAFEKGLELEDWI
ncbi:hypothetical protein BKA65DRAFT_470943 [Rhexocercosporidium sp. MPI-PUGE-AT-0058]|nr:hypothetical protein BKA65DRAFT_470943 [Rhexocercosporidium sp. MPI-PUGE-AT-0058]